MFVVSVLLFGYWLIACHPKTYVLFPSDFTEQLRVTPETTTGMGSHVVHFLFEGGLSFKTER